eukprot:2290148-Rhodomonas_salina.1
MVAGKGATPIGQIEVDDEVLSAEGNSRVFFIHDHKKASKTLRIATEQDSMELTPVHYLPVYTEACGERYCSAAKQVRAESVRVGDRVYVHSAMGFLAKVTPLPPMKHVLERGDAGGPRAALRMEGGQARN